jgi:hypothetical protein
MLLVQGRRRQEPLSAWVTASGSIALLAVAILAGGPTAAKTVAPVVVLVAIVGTFARELLSWRKLLVGLVGLILFVPIRRYTLPASLPFQLEPYRLYVLLLVVGWAASLLVDRRVRARRSGFEAPMAAVVVLALVTVIANANSIGSQGIWQEVTKKLTFFASFVLVFYVVVSLVRTEAHLEAIVRALVGCTAVVGFFSVVEFNTRMNVFNKLSKVMPLLRPQDTGFHSLEIRAGHLRVYASSEHPIALGALFVMILPLAIYVWKRTGQRRWLVAIGLVLMGTLSTVSRTSILMLLLMAIIYFRLRPRDIKKLIPWLVPLLVVVHIALPGSIGSLQQAFFPKGGLIKEQEGDAGTRGSGRVADLGPSLTEWSHHPLFGEGFGTRIVDVGPHHNAEILDDQWLGTLLETGLLGVAIWVWFFVRFVRRLLRAARADDSPRHWLYAGLGSGIAAYAFGAVFYDAFSFIQVTLVMFVLCALGSVLLHVRDAELAAAARRQRRWSF